MRTMEFTIENIKAFEIGQEIEVTEGKLPSSYYYTMEHALGTVSYTHLDVYKRQESGVSFLPMEKMFSTTDVVSAKKHTGLIAALVGGSILILLILIGLVIFAGKKISTYMDDRKEASEVVWEEDDEEEFRTPEDLSLIHI